MKLDEKRRNEIAWKYVLQRTEGERIRLSPDEILRRLGKTAKDLNISKQEAAAFAKELLEHLSCKVLDALEQASEQGESKGS